MKLQNVTRVVTAKIPLLYAFPWSLSRPALPAGAGTDAALVDSVDLLREESVARFYRIAIGVLFLWPAVAGADPVNCSLLAPFTIRPSRVSGTGPSGAGPGGCFSLNGFDNLEVAIGTDRILGPGTLLLDFGGIVKDLPGDDFAVRTFNLWGPLAGATRAEFWLNGKLQSSTEKTLGPSELFTFDLASVSMNQVRLVNTSADPPGVNDLATMYFMDAAVTNLTPTPTTPEPTAILLLGTGLVALAMRKRHPAGQRV